MIKHFRFILSAATQKQPRTAQESPWKEKLLQSGHPRAEGRGLEGLSVKLGFSEQNP